MYVICADRASIAYRRQQREQNFERSTSASDASEHLLTMHKNHQEGHQLDSKQLRS